MKLKPFSIRLKPWQWAVAALLLAAVVIALSYVLPEAVDFHNYFRPAATGVLHGNSPYRNEGFFNTP